MIHKHNKRIAKCLATVIVVLLLTTLCGCAQMAAAFQDEAETSDGEVPVYSPIFTPPVSPSEALKDETFNPLWEFYTEFDAQTRQQTANMERALAGAGKASQHLAKAAMEQMNVAVRAAYTSVGRLTFDSSGLYNGSVVGAVSGSGTLQKNADELSYTMRFSYEDGASLYGVLTEKTVVYVIGSVSHGYTCCAIVKNDDGYRVVTDAYGIGAVMQIEGGTIAFATLNFIQPVLEFDASQSDAPNLALYDPSYLNIDLNSSDISSYWQLKDGKLELVSKPDQTLTQTDEP